MNDAMRTLVRDLLGTRKTGSLATLHNGDPAVSMVPFVVTTGATFVVHVSGLAAHTRDMTASPRVAIMITAAEEDDVMPQALPRISIAADARQLTGDAPEYPEARAAYLARFPDSEPMFDLGDFSIFLLTPRSARIVAGFGAATTASPEDLAAALA